MMVIAATKSPQSPRLNLAFEDNNVIAFVTVPWKTVCRENMCLNMCSNVLCPANTYVDIASLSPHITPAD